MNLSNTAKEAAANYLLSDYPWVEGHVAFDKIKEDPEVLDECVIWQPFTPYNYGSLAEMMQDHAETVQEAMDEAAKSSNTDKPTTLKDIFGDKYVLIHELEDGEISYPAISLRRNVVTMTLEMRKVAVTHELPADTPIEVKDSEFKLVISGETLKFHLYVKIPD